MRNSILGIVVTILFISFLLPAVAIGVEQSSALGVSPGSMKNDILLQGSEFEEEFVVSRKDVDSEAKVVIEILSDGFEDWINFPGGLEVTMQEGVQNVGVIAEFKVPSDAALKRYSGAIRFKLEEKDTEGQVVIVPAVRVDLNFTVTDKEQKDFEVRLVEIDNFCRNNPLVLKLKVKNTGNVNVRPDKVEVEIADITDNFVTSLETSDIPEVKPFSIEEHTLELADHGLSLGDYFALVKVYNEDEIFFEDKVAFTVLDECLLQTASTENVEKDSNALLTFLKIVGIVVVFGGIVYLFLINKKEKIKRSGK